MMTVGSGGTSPTLLVVVVKEVSCSGGVLARFPLEFPVEDAQIIEPRGGSYNHQYCLIVCTLSISVMNDSK